MEIFRDTDFGTLILQSPGGDKVNYPSQVGFMKGTHVGGVFHASATAISSKSIRELASQKDQPSRRC